MSGFKSIFLIASLMAMGALSVDTMLPALLMIKSHFDLPSFYGHWTITIVFLGISIGQLLFGPISDTFGRRNTAIAGLLIFGIFNIASIFTINYQFFLVCRFFQGLGAGATVVVSRAIARDIYTGHELAKLMSLVSTIFILVPIFSPSIGQLIINTLSWQFIPIIITLFCFSLVCWITLFHVETLKHRRVLDFSNIFKGILEVFHSKISRNYTLTAGLTFGVLISFLNISQPLFQEYLGVGKYFPLYFGAGALAIGFGSLINAQLVSIIAPKKIVQTSMQLTLIWSFLFLLFFLFDGTRDVKTVMIFFLPIFFLFGTIFGNVNAIAISPMGHIAGTASAVIGTSTTLLALPIASLVAIFFSGTLVPFICLVIVTNSLNLLITRKMVLN